MAVVFEVKLVSAAFSADICESLHFFPAIVTKLIYDSILLHPAQEDSECSGPIWVVLILVYFRKLEYVFRFSVRIKSVRKEIL